MWRAMVRDLRAHRGRLAMTLASIVLGVAFVVSSWVLADSTAASVRATDLRSDVDVVVSGHDLTDADLADLAALPGVSAARGVLAGRAALVGTDGKLVAGPHDTAGTGWDRTDRFVLTAGREPRGPGEVAAADGTELSTGDTARVFLADGRQVRATVVGTFGYRTVGSEPAPRLAYDQDSARSMFGSYHWIELTGEHIAVPPAPGRQVDTARALGEQAAADAEAAAGSTRETLLAFAAVALLVGGFVIANTFAMLVTQRVRQYALLRAVGATRRQVRRAVLGEAAALGAAGATGGVLLGLVLAFTALVLAQDDTEFVVSPLGILVGYAVGVGVTVVAAHACARRAATIAPVAALRTDALTPPHRTRRVRVAAGLLLVAAGVATVAATSGVDDLGTTERIVGLGGGIVAWLGVLVLAPELSTALRPVAALLTRLGGPATRLGARNALRDPRRTAATSSALLVGLALVCAFATLGETMVSMFGDTVRATVPATTTVLRPAAGDEPLGTDVLDRVRDTPGVTGAAAQRYGSATVATGGRTTVSAIEPDAFGTLLTPPLVAGTADLRTGFVVGTNEAAMLGVGLGDQITLDFDGERVTRPVVGLHTTTEAQPLFYLDVAAAPAWLRDRTTTVYATGTDPAAVRTALDRAFAGRPDVRVTDREGVIDEDMGEFAAVLAVMYAMFGAAVVIAIFGVVNTLALSVLERRREIGVLRAVGARRRLVRRAVRVESLVICGYGGITGIVVGVGFGAVMQHVMLGRELFAISVPYLVIGVSLAGMVAVGVLAALWPARRAARTDVLVAIATR